MSDGLLGWISSTKHKIKLNSKVARPAYGAPILRAVGLVSSSASKIATVMYNEVIKPAIKARASSIVFAFNYGRLLKLYVHCRKAERNYCAGLIHSSENGWEYRFAGRRSYFVHARSQLWVFKNQIDESDRDMRVFTV